MKKFLIFLISVCLPPIGLSALPVGNPVDASLLYQGVFGERYFNSCDSMRRTDLLSLRAGYYGDYVFDRRMEVDAKNRGSNLHKTKICTNAGYIALNVYNRLDLYAAPGVSYIKIETPQSAFDIVSNPNNYFYIDTETQFSYTLGADAMILRFGRFVLGADGKYFQTQPRVNSVRVEEGPVDYIKARLKYTEWQVAAGISYILPISCSIDVVPYGAIKWAQSKGDFGETQDNSNTHILFDIKNTRCIGYAIGVTLTGCVKWDLTVEGRFYDELAFDFNTQFRF